MKKLKNWTLTAESIKQEREGLIRYHNYIMSEADHKGQTVIPLTDKGNLFRVALKSDRFNLARKLTKGGRPSNYGWSVAMSYPFDISNENLKTIYERVMRLFYEYVDKEIGLNMPNGHIQAVIMKEALAVIHRGGGVHNHLHIVMPKHLTSFVEAGKGKTLVSVDLTKKKFLHRLKLINNQVVNEVVGMDVLEYEIEAVRTHKKRISKRLAKKIKADDKSTAEYASKAREAIDTLYKSIERYREWAKENQVHDEQAIKYLDRAEKQLEKGNTIRAAKTLEKLDNPQKQPAKPPQTP